MDTCYSCGEKLKAVKDKPYRYDECGLDVVLQGIAQYVCESCGESYVSLPHLQDLHRIIGANICQNMKGLLLPEEIRFLRKDLHLKAKDLARTLGVTASAVSRWENGKSVISEAHDRLLRSVYMLYASEQSQQILYDVITFFQDLPAKRKAIHHRKGMVLNPQEWLSRFGEPCPA